jgi:hypothetical protein
MQQPRGAQRDVAASDQENAKHDRAVSRAG